MSGNTIPNFLKKIYRYIVILISMAGYVPKNASFPRNLVMSASLVFAIYLSIYQTDNSSFAILYFTISEFLYIGFITAVLLRNGLRHWIVKIGGDENKGYLIYETILGFLFFHNGVSIGYMASSNPGRILHFNHSELFMLILAFMFISGFTIKLFAAKAVTVEIYYWKDMFLGRKVADFVEDGPYKYFNNPMYGIGQLPAYATAIWYHSIYGLVAALLNQALIFSFYFMVEKKFINRVYNPDNNPNSEN